MQNNTSLHDLRNQEQMECVVPPAPRGADAKEWATDFAAVRRATVALAQGDSVWAARAYRTGAQLLEMSHAPDAARVVRYQRVWAAATRGSRRPFAARGAHARP